MDFKSIERLCMGCLGEMNENERYCSKCGFDNEQPREPQHLSPRSILAGKYLVGRVLGEGGFGITYLGFDLNLNIKVAIKEYFPAGFVARSGDSSTVTPFTGSSADYYSNGIEKFLNEARSLARFHNLDGIVEVRDFFRENGTAYIVMEFVDGVDLREELERRGGRMPVPEVMELMMPLISSLAKVHQTGIVHRDISPDNIMLTVEGKLKLLDFGAARDTGGSKSVSVVLKPGYAPEEQYRTHGELGAWTDIYALCGTIYKLITGATPPESIERLTNDTLKPPSRLGVAISPAQEAALMRGLNVRKEGRFATTGELYAALYGGAGAGAGTGAGASYAPAGGQTYAPQGGASYAPANPSGQYVPAQGGAPKGGFGKLWQEKRGLVIAGIGGVVFVAVLLVVLFTKGGGKPTGGEALLTPSAVIPPTATAELATDAPATAAPTEDVSLAMTATFVDPALFFEQKSKSSTTGEGTVYTFTGIDSYMVIDYITILQSQGYDVEIVAEDDVLFTITEGGAVMTFLIGSDGESMQMVCPNGVTLDLSDAPVTEHYLQNNGLSAEQWWDLGGTSLYSYSGVNYMGNTNPNNQNSPEAAVQGNMLYLADNNTHSGIYAIDWTTGDVVTQLVTDDRLLLSLNVLGDYLYYCTVESQGEGSFDYTLYRVKTDGSELTEPLQEGTRYLMVYGNYAYYKDYETNALMRYNLNTLNAEKVLPFAGYYPNISGGRIYCVDSGSSTGIYSYALDGSDEQFIWDADCYSMAVCGGWIYYVTSSDDGSKLRRVDIDGENDELVISDAVSSFAISSNIIYYSTVDDYELKSYDIYNDTTDDVVSFGKYPTFVETASDITLFYNNEDGDLCIYDFEDHTGTAIDLS